MNEKHSMKVAARRTGLSPHLIRMWERRYGAVVPDRTSTGRRFYSDEDIARLDLLRRATESGESIGQIANLSLSDLGILAGSPSAAPSVRAPRDGVATAAEYLERALQFTRRLDPEALESTLLEASSALGQTQFLDNVIMPLLDKTGELWERGDMRISHEHMATSVVRSLLGSIVVTQVADIRGPLMISTTPFGQYHELGALVAAVVAVSAGWRSMYLGPDLPAEEIAAAANEHNARAVALSLVYPHDDPRIALELRKLGRLLDPATAVLVGGRASGGYAAAIAEIRARRLESLADLRTQLSSLRYQNPTVQPGQEQ